MQRAWMPAPRRRSRPLLAAAALAALAAEAPPAAATAFNVTLGMNYGGNCNQGKHAGDLHYAFMGNLAFPTRALLSFFAVGDGHP